jgi:AcrR family transcriptional regulator
LGTLRDKNMSLRRRRILDSARRILAESGYDKLSIRILADRSRVTAPTIYHLVGGKAEVINVLVQEMATSLNSAQLFKPSVDPIAAVGVMMQRIANFIAKDEAYYRELLIAWEVQQRFENFEPSGTSGFSMHSISTVVESAQEASMLRSDVDLQFLRLHVWNCYRIARHDWVHDRIDLDRFRHQASSGMLYCLLGAAKEEYRERILTAITKSTRAIDDERTSIFGFDNSPFL